MIINLFCTYIDIIEWSDSRNTGTEILFTMQTLTLINATTLFSTY